MLNDYTTWPDLGQAIRYDRRWWNSQGQEHAEIRYSITSLLPETAEAAHLLVVVRPEWRIELSVVRGEGRIENCLYYIIVATKVCVKIAR